MSGDEPAATFKMVLCGDGGTVSTLASELELEQQNTAFGKLGASMAKSQ